MESISSIFGLESRKLRALIIAAHPDDEVLGAGGFSAKFSANIDISCIFVCEGSSCRYVDPTSATCVSEIEQRREAARQAGSILGINSIEFGLFRCGALSSYPLIEVNHFIERAIDEFEPDLILTHWQKDNNDDHATVAKSVGIAVRSQKNLGRTRAILAFEVPSSTEYVSGQAFNPNFFVRLTKKQLTKKIDALYRYSGEVHSSIGPRSKYGLSTYAQFRGLAIGVEYAEAFMLTKVFV